MHVIHVNLDQINKIMNERMKTKSVFGREIHPLMQVKVFGGMMIVGIVIASLLSSKGSHLVYEVALSILLCFALFNSIMSLSYGNNKNYWFYSTLSYVFLLIAGLIMCYLLSGVSIFDLQLYRWLFLVFTIVYLVFMSIVRGMRKLIEWAEKR